jgi:hypothetical protein
LVLLLYHVFWNAIYLYTVVEKDPTISYYLLQKPLPLLFHPLFLPFLLPINIIFFCKPFLVDNITILNMLQDQFREYSKIENEYRKLLIAWELELSVKPSTDIKKLKINRSEHIQFRLMHLFNGYLDQIWKDSQNMLQFGQEWTNQSDGLYPTDDIFSINILGLHLMKQSLLKRQELFSIVAELNGKRDIADTLSRHSSDSSRLSQDLYAYKRDQQKHIFTDLDQQEFVSHTTINCSDKDFDSYFDIPENKCADDFSDNSSVSLASNRRIRLRNSPSTPTISQDWTTEANPCTYNFAPACNYSAYYPKNKIESNTDEATQHKLSCHFCQETLPLRKSFSVDNLHSLQQNLLNTTTDDEEEGEGKEDSCSSFEIASVYYYSESEDEEVEIERELLIEKDDSIAERNRGKYELLSESTDDSTKIEIYHYCGSSSSSSPIIHYESASKEFKRNEVKRCPKLIYGRIELSPTCSSQSTSSSDDDSSGDDNTKNSKNRTEPSPKLHLKQIGDIKSKDCDSSKDDTGDLSVTDEGSARTFSKTKLARLTQKKKSSRKNTGANSKQTPKKEKSTNRANSIVRSLSNVNMKTLCTIFFSKNLTPKISNNK